MVLRSLDRPHARDESAQPPRAGPASSPAERVATWLSLACAVHCLLVPIAVSTLPLLGATGLTELGSAAELLLTALVVASAIAGASWGYRRHHDLRVVLSAGVGLVAYLLGHLLHGSWYGVALAVGGALMLAASSFVSARLSHICKEPSCAH